VVNRLAGEQALAGAHQLAEEAALRLGAVTEDGVHLDAVLHVHHHAGLADGGLAGVELDLHVLHFRSEDFVVDDVHGHGGCSWKGVSSGKWEVGCIARAAYRWGRGAGLQGLDSPGRPGFRRLRGPGLCCVRCGGGCAAGSLPQALEVGAADGARGNRGRDLAGVALGAAELAHPAAEGHDALRRVAHRADQGVAGGVAAPFDEARVVAGLGGVQVGAEHGIEGLDVGREAGQDMSAGIA
jgi:hypothetical protein